MQDAWIICLQTWYKKKRQYSSFFFQLVHAADLVWSFESEEQHF